MVSVTEDCCSTQIIDANGNFDAQGLERFMKTVKLADKGLSYAVVSIMGPQSSGKSTLLNHLFHTTFREMDAFSGRLQTTKGVWVAKAVGIEPFTVVMDLEGTDGRERGEDDTAFEKQSALFALAISDIVLVNIWCHDIGREHAANRPLLKTVFQVMLRLFSPRKTTLLLVIRDKTKTPLEYLEKILREDIQKIWDAVPKPEGHKDTPLREFFNVEVTALSSYEQKEEEFKKEVAELRKRFFHSNAPGGLAGDRRGVIPASGFSYSAQQIWKVIRENKDLDLPAHKVMVATYRCEEIANEKLEHLASDKDWLELEKTVKVGPIPSFGKKLSSILDAYISEYDAETLYFDEGVRSAKRQFLKSRALQYVSPAFEAMVGHIKVNALEMFKNDLDKSLDSGKGFAMSVRDCTASSLRVFDNACADIRIKHANWDTSKAREELRHDIEAHASAIRGAKLSELQADYEKKIRAALVEPLEELLDAAGPHTWESIRNLFKRETEKALTDFSSSLSTFELDKETSDMMKRNLKDYARRVVESKAREEAGKVLIRMKDRFSRVFSHDEESMPRVWTGKEDIRYITKNASAEALELLSAMAAIRLDDKPDRIQDILKSTLLDAPAAQTKRLEAASDPLASSTWPEIPPEKTLITPVRCKSLWKQFKTETEYTVAQAVAAQEAQRLGKSSIPPLWTILMIAVLGFNEFMALLRSPLYLLLLFVAFLFFKALWHQLNMAETFEHGTLSGLLTLSGRFLPAVMNLLRKLTEEAQGYSQNVMAHLPDHLTSQSYRSQSHKHTRMSSFSSTDSSPRSGIDDFNQPGNSDTEESTS